MLQNLPARKYMGITSEESLINYDFLKVLKNKLLDVFTVHFKKVNNPIYISGSLIDQVCIKKALIKEF